MDHSITNENWLNIRLGDLAKRITKGGTPTTYGYSFQTSGINFIKVENIKNRNIDLQSVSDFISQEAHDFQSKSQLLEGDILFSIAGTIGETCIVKKEHLPANTNQALAIIKGTSNYIEPNLLRYQLDAFVTMVKAKARGGAMNNVSLDDLKRLFVKIPPREEQSRLLNKMNKLFGSLDKGIENLKTVQQQLKVYRQAVLKWAFEDRLTNKNVVDGELPEGWKWFPVKEVARSIQYGYTASSSSDKIGPKFLRITDIQENRVNWEKVPHCAISDAAKQKYLLKDGDLVFARTGATVGKSFLIKGSIPEAIYASYLICLRFPKEVFDKYVWYYFQSPFYWNQIIDKQVGIGQPNVNGTTLGRMKIVICPLPDQHAIVSEIESRLSVCDKVEETINNALIEAESLRQSILKKAFEGKLVPQDPNDEPASMLLERIRQGRSVTTGLKTKRRNRT